MIPVAIRSGRGDTRPDTVRVNVREHLESYAAELRAAVARVDAMTPGERRRVVAEIRAKHATWRPMVGLAGNPTTLYRPGEGNQKTAKNAAKTVTYTGSPATSGRVLVEWLGEPIRLVFNSCQWSGKCARVCVLRGGRGAFSSVRAGRVWRDLVAYRDPVGWIMVRRAELIAVADSHGAVLERGDVGTELGLADFVPGLYADTPTGSTVRGYDYGKRPGILAGTGWTPDRHHRTVYSWSESSDPRAVNRFLARGGNVVVVTDLAKGDPVPDMWRIGSKSWPTVNGDTTDDRLSDPAGHVVILFAKGAATSTRHRDRLAGFVMPVAKGGTR